MEQRRVLPPSFEQFRDNQISLTEVKKEFSAADLAWRSNRNFQSYIKKLNTKIEDLQHSSDIALHELILWRLEELEDCIRSEFKAMNEVGVKAELNWELEPLQNMITGIKDKLKKLTK